MAQVAQTFVSPFS